MIYFYLFCFYWHILSIIYFGRFQLYCFACTWFFAIDRENLEEPLADSFEWSLRFHVGSIVLCALVLPIVMIIQTPISYAKQLYETIEGENILFRCIGGIFSTFETVFLYVNKYGLIKTSLDGSRYFTGCFDSLDIMNRNILRNGALNDVVDIALFMFNFLVAGVIVYGMDLYLNNSEYQQSNKYETYSILMVNSFIKFFKILFLVSFFTSMIITDTDVNSAEALIFCHSVDEHEYGHEIFLTGLNKT